MPVLDEAWLFGYLWLLEPGLTREKESEQKKCWLGLGGHDVEIRSGRTVVGRHDSCDLVLDDPLASRRHAIIEFEGNQLSIEDLGSVNGVMLNGARITGRVAVTDGDELRLGNQSLRVHLVGHHKADSRSRRVGARTLSNGRPMTAPPPSEEESTVVREGEALETLAIVADKVLAMGRGQEAERILSNALSALLVRARNGSNIEGPSLQTAAQYAVRIAQVTGKPRWIDYVFDLYSASKRVLPGPIVEGLYTSIRSVPGVSIERLRSYLAVIHGKQKELGPSELFIARRIEGLEKLVAL